MLDLALWVKPKIFQPYNLKQVMHLLLHFRKIRIYIFMTVTVRWRHGQTNGQSLAIKLQHRLKSFIGFCVRLYLPNKLLPKSMEGGIIIVHKVL